MDRELYQTFQSISFRKQKSRNYISAFFISSNNLDRWYVLGSNPIDNYMFKIEYFALFIKHYREEKIDKIIETFEDKKKLVEDNLLFVSSMYRDYKQYSNVSQEMIDELFLISRKYNVRPMLDKYFIREKIQEKQSTKEIGSYEYIPLFLDDIVFNREFYNLEDMKNMNTNFNAYFDVYCLDNKYSMEELKELQPIIKDNESLQNRCECGAEIIIHKNNDTNSYSHIECLNPKCYIKYKFIISETIKEFNVKGLGSTVISRYCKETYYKDLFINGKPKHLFKNFMEPNNIKKYLTNIEYNKALEFYKIVKECEESLGDYLHLLCIPKIGRSIGDKLTKDEILNFTDIKSISTLCNNKGIKASSIHIQIFNYLEELKYFLKFSDKVGQLIDTNEDIRYLNLVITGGVSMYCEETNETIKYRNKQAFVDECNNIAKQCKKKSRFILKTSVTRETHFCVYPPGTGSSKLDKALDLQGITPIQVLTAEELIKKIKEV